jgi:hypothetical protein
MNANPTSEKRSPTFDTRNSKLEIRTAFFRFSFFDFRFSSLELRISLLLLSVFICVHLWFPPLIYAQETGQEVVANLASGRVVIYVAKDGIAIAANEGRVEAESRPPLVAQLSGKRIAILLGAAEWVHPGTGRPPLRLDFELPRALGKAVGTGPRLQQEQASDLVPIGDALLEPLRTVVLDLTRKMDLRPDDPLVEMLLVGYEEEYGPEVWLLQYRLAQEPLRGDYWKSRILRPSFTQLYPPEKGQPRTLIEVRYPPEDKGPALLELLRQSDARLTPLRTSNAQAARASEKASSGESNKAQLDDCVVFLRAALDAIAPPSAVQIVAVISERRGFEWILAPPAALMQKAEDVKPAEPGAPTLRKPPQK